jgi:hypothetical protein
MKNTKRELETNYSLHLQQKNKAEELYDNQEKPDVFDEIINSNRKMSDLERFYTQEMDQGETKHITRHIV